MVRDPGGMEAPRQVLGLLQVGLVKGVGGSNRQRHTMADDRIAGAYRFQYRQGATAGYHEIFADDFQPINRRMGCQQRLIMLPAQTDPASQGGELSAVHWLKSQTPAACGSPRCILDAGRYGL